MQPIFLTIIFVGVTALGFVSLIAVERIIGG
jgi:hypothetical protein